MTTKSTTTGTSIYREAVLEAADLRARALQDAQNAVLEALGPQIRQYVDKELTNGFGKKEGFLILEQDETLPATNAPAPQTPEVGVVDSPSTNNGGTSGGVEPTVPPQSVSQETPAAAAAVDSDASGAGAPVTPAGDAIPLPGPDGKITVDLDSLFVASDSNSSVGALEVPTDGSEPSATADAGEPTAPAATPTTVNLPVTPTDTSVQQPEPTPPATPVATDTTQQLSETTPKEKEEKLTITFEAFDSALGVAEQAAEAETSVISEEKLLRMYEVLKENKTNWKLDETVFTLVSDRIEILLEKVDQTANSYTSKGKQSMTTRTLKDFARSLLEDASAGFGDGAGVKPGVKNSNESGKASTHAMSASHPEAKDPGKKEALTLNGKAVPGSELSEDASAGAGEEMGAAEKELMEMISGMEDAKPGSAGSGGADKEDKKALLEKKLASLREEQEKLMSELQECGMDMAEAGEGVNVNITIDAPGASVAGSDHGHHADLSGGMSDLGRLSDDDEIELVDDEDDADLALSSDDEDADEASMSADTDDTEMAGDEAGEESDTTKKMLAENKQLKNQLAETQLLTARSLYVNKLFAAHDLSGKLKHGIVRYLDSARTIEEAKAAYHKVKTQLNEAVKKKKTAIQVGNVGASVSAMGSTTINENTASHQAASGYGAIGLGTAERWQELAGIKVK